MHTHQKKCNCKSENPIAPVYKISPTNSRSEREADEVANQVMSGQTLSPIANVSSLAAPQRKCSECDEEVQRKSGDRKSFENGADRIIFVGVYECLAGY